MTGLLARPDNAEWLLVFGHGAGAPMRHHFMEGLAARLAERRVATFRYNFPYTEQGGRAPNHRPILIKTIRSAVGAASAMAPDLDLLAGGKSMGGRMTSLAQSAEPLPGVRGLVFFGFPLHPAGKPSVDRGDHLAGVAVPMLFLQGTRDKLAELPLLEPVCASLEKRATLHICEGADHGFHVLKRSGRTEEEVLDELANETKRWAETLGP